MKEYLKGVLAEGKPGLYICEILTGYGKTYNSVQAIVEYIREQHPNKKIFFLTTLKKNLPDDDFKRAFADDDPSKKEVLRIQSNLDEVCDGIHTVDVPERFQSTAYKALLHAVDRYLTVKNKVYDAEYVESLRKQANEAESAFRFELGYQLRAVESDPDRLLSLIESHKDFKWVGLLYPAVFTKKASVIQMSVNKFLTRNATIIEPSYAFLSSEMIKDSVIIIDEFDATKSTIKEVIIEKSLRLCDEYLNLFRQIVSFFDTDNNTFITGAYCDALYRLGVTEEELYAITIQYRMQFSAVGPSRVQIAYQDDLWEICKRENTLLLMHNNYEILDDYTRRFTGDFHLQKYSNKPYAISSFIKIMTSYSWDEHIALLKAEEAKRAAEQERQRAIDQLASVENFLKLKKRSLLYDYYIILDCNGKAAKYFYRSQVNLQEVCYEESEELYKLRMYRVRRKQIPLFTECLNTLKEYSIQLDFLDYAEQCVLKLQENQSIKWKKPGTRSRINRLWRNMKRSFNLS